jgi:hypothetical protein
MSDFTLYVIGAAEPQGESSDVATIPGKGTELHSLTAIRRWFTPVANEVSADKLLASFEKTQKAIDAMLARLEAQESRGYRLDEFEVSLAVSGEGTIGIVTASAEAGVVLKFKRAQDGAKPTT